MKIDIIYGQEDWVGLYVDGELAQEGHSLRVLDVLTLLHKRGGPIEHLEWSTVNDFGELALNARGCMPRLLSDTRDWVDE